MMLEMRDKGYEIYGDRLYIIRDARLKGKSDFRAFIDAARTCTVEFSKQLSGYHFTETAEQLPLNSPRAYRWGIIYSFRQVGLLLAALFAGVVLGNIIEQLLKFFVPQQT